MPNPAPDPFDQSSDYRKVMREAKIGILMLVMLVGFFVYVVYYRVERFKSQLPQYVLDAPVANLVEPDQYFHQLKTSATAEANNRRAKTNSLFLSRRKLHHLRKRVPEIFPRFSQDFLLEKAIKTVLKTSMWMSIPNQLSIPLSLPAQTLR